MDSKDKVYIQAFLVPGRVAANHPQLTLKRQLPKSAHTQTTKKRQKSASTRDDIIAKYKQDVEASWQHELKLLNPWFQPEGLYLECKRINSSKLPIGFTCVSEDRFQYNFTDPRSPKGIRFRPLAYRLPFLKKPDFYNKTFSVSHLCHNNWCYNWNHHVLEILEINKSRNGCPAGPSCRHKVKCLRPGFYSES